jgi:hypothetical protein
MRGYAGAERLKWRRHEHKAAVAPFFEVVLRFLAQIPGLQTHLRWDPSEPESPLSLGIRFPFMEENQWLYPIPPLNFSLSANDNIHDFAPEVENFVNDHNVRTIQALIEQRANLRNEVLYASEQGIPTVTGSIEQFLTLRRDSIYKMLGTFILIESHVERQLLVQQALTAFLRIVPRLGARSQPASSGTGSTFPSAVESSDEADGA